MSDGAPASTLQPAGLGGWLWPVTWATAVLPVFLIASVAASVPSLIEYLEQGKADPYPVDITWAYRAMGLNVLLTLGSWWWAIRWFGRNPRLPRQGPVALLALGVLVAAIGWIDRPSHFHPALAAMPIGLATVGYLCARWSKRIRNTFVPHALPARADEFDAALFGGPRDWSRGYWLLPGALAYAVFGVFSEGLVFAKVASQALPLPYPAGPPHDGCIRGLGFTTMGNAYSVSQIETHREALAISHLAALLILGALVGFARGARWTAWLAMLALAFAMAAPLRVTLGKWCSPILDHTDFRGMWHEWCIVLILVAMSTAYRRWRREVSPRLN
jgi:hypothetical protein